jgi:hypothetical protein
MTELERAIERLEAVKKSRRKHKTLEERFWSLVDRRGKNECWEWIGFRNGRAYGHFCIDSFSGTKRRKINAHSMAYILINGDIPEGLVVCHSCDNRICCNPKHLWVGTQYENVKDMMKKKRQIGGENQPFIYSGIKDNYPSELRRSPRRQKMLNRKALAKESDRG